VLAGAGALYFTLAAKAAKDDVQKSVTAQIQGGPPWDQGRQADQRRDQTLATVFTVTAGAAVTAGALLLILNPTSQPRVGTSAFISVQPGAVRAAYSRSF
jgi:hypothetical protein